MSSIESLIKTDRYQVFLLTSPPSLPLSFARHPWFVVNKKGIISRWEVIYEPDKYNAQTKWGHLTYNVLPPFQGLRISYSSDKRSWKPTLVKVIEGDETSVAGKMGEFIENSPRNYPHLEDYSFTGSNSNTYVQWVIDKFPESGMKLPWNAFGKNRA